MASSKTQIFNMALLPLGVKRVASDTEESNQAKTLNTLYDQCLEEALASGPKAGWKFANTRVTINADSQAPAFGYDYQFTIPIDCMKVVSVSSGGTELTDWKREGRKIMTNLASGSVDVVYTQKITLVGLFPPHFTKVLYTLLSIQSAYYLTQQTGLAQTLERDYKISILPRAQGLDAGEQYVEESSSEWVDAGR